MSRQKKQPQHTFRQEIESADANTKRIAAGLEAFVEASVSEDEAGKVESWNSLIAAIDERLDNRITHLSNKLLSGKELSTRLREYDYKQGDTRVVL